jgi:uncharacterized OB-fold protein
MADKVKVTEARTDHADGSRDPHQATRPNLSLAEQRAKLKDEEIWGFHCRKCSYDQFSPMVRCSKCGSRDIATRRFSKEGSVVSYTIQTVASEQFINETPFAFAIIQLDDGPRISGWVPWISKPADLPQGSKVHYVPSYKPGMMFEKS